MSKLSVNGVEPKLGSYVYASIPNCPSRVLWVRTGTLWTDDYGYELPWESLVEPIDTLAPTFDDGSSK